MLNMTFQIRCSYITEYGAAVTKNEVILDVLIGTESQDMSLSKKSRTVVIVHHHL